MSANVAALSFSLSSLYFADERSTEGAHVATRNNVLVRNRHGAHSPFQEHTKRCEFKCLI